MKKKIKIVDWKNQKNNRDKMFNKIIEFIEEKRYYLLSTEKSKTTRFFVEYLMEIYIFLELNMKGY